MGEHKPLSEAELRAWRGLNQAGLLLQSLLDRHLKRNYSFIHADYGVLRRLQDAPENRLRLNELSQQVWFSRSRLAHQMTRLEKAGLVARSRNAGSRATFVCLTPEGRKTIEAASQDVRDLVRRHLFVHVDQRELRILGDALGRVAEHLRSLPELDKDG